MLYSPATKESKQMDDIMYVFKRITGEFVKKWQNGNIFKTTLLPSKSTENNIKHQKKKTSLMKRGKAHNHKPQNMKIIFQILKNFKERCWEMTKNKKQRTSSDLKPWTGCRCLKGSQSRIFVQWSSNDNSKGEWEGHGDIIYHPVKTQVKQPRVRKGELERKSHHFYAPLCFSWREGRRKSRITSLLRASKGFTTNCAWTWDELCFQVDVKTNLGRWWWRWHLTFAAVYQPTLLPLCSPVLF